MIVSDFAKITHHEGAIVCSYETVLPFPLPQVQPQLETLLEKVSRFVEAQEGIVGHIKVHASESGRCVTLSTTGNGVTATPGCNEETAVSFTAIVFAVDEKKLRTLVEQLIDQMI